MHFIFFTCLQCNDYIVYYHGFQQTVMVFRRSSGKALGNFSLPAPASCFLTTDGESDGVGGRSKKKLIIGGKVHIICIKDDFTNGRAFFCLDYPRNTILKVGHLCWAGTVDIFVISQLKWLKLGLQAHLFKMFGHAKFQLSISCTYKLLNF